MKTDRLEHSLNAIEAWSPQINFIPLVGPRYDEGLTQGVRVLILGESHYREDLQDPDPDRGCTHRNFQGYLEGCDLTGESQFFQKLPKIVTRQLTPTQAESVFAWERVAYANAVQSFVSGPSTSPTDEQFSAAGPALKELAAALKPQAILMLGKRLWDGIPPDVGVWSNEPPIAAEKENRRIWLVPTGDAFARVSWIFHPSRHTESIESAIGVFEKLLERCTGGPARALIAT